MELKRRLDPRVVFAGIYIALFAIYIIVGLQPAGAAEYTVDARVMIPAVGIETDVTELTLGNNGLETPGMIAGSYTRASNKTLLIGHSTTAFRGLDQARLGDQIDYDDRVYHIVAIDMVQKSQVEMNKILAGAEKDTLVLMTCAGELLDGGDATHRLIITAIR